MGSFARVIGSAGAGAAVMYLLDPDRGRRRRTRITDHMVSSVTRSRRAFGKMVRDFDNRMEGVRAAALSVFDDRLPSDAVLVERVRSCLGHFVSHPRAIEVSVRAGRVTLEGPILAEEAEHLLRAVSLTAGVRDIENRLEVHPTADVPPLQGNRVNSRTHPELRTAWTPASRLFATVTGSVLVGYGLSTGGTSGKLAGLVGLGTLLRSITNRDLPSTFGFGENAAVSIQKAITIDAPVEEVFAFWSHFPNFPRFMTHLKEVRDLGQGRSHWLALGPAGVPVSWDAEVTKQAENQLLEWKSIPGSTIENSGSVRFDAEPGGRTRIAVFLEYKPPAGTVGHAVASLFGINPKQEMNDDFVRLKSLIEDGKTRAHGETVRKEEIGKEVTR